jgi:hypothetical protein
MRSATSKGDLRSLALSRAAVERLVGDWPGHVPLVRRDIAAMRAAGSCAELYLARWEALLVAGPETLAATILAGSDEAQVLRSVHPFAGILSPRERWAILANLAA